MKFFSTALKDGRRIIVALDHVENVHADAAGDAVFVMLPADGGQRIFETSRSYEDTAQHLLSIKYVPKKEVT